MSPHWIADAHHDADQVYALRNMPIDRPKLRKAVRTNHRNMALRARYSDDRKRARWALGETGVTMPPAEPDVSSAAVCAMLSGLTSRQADAVHLYARGLTITQIGHAIGGTIQNASYLVRAGLQTLREKQCA